MTRGSQPNAVRLALGVTTPGENLPGGSREDRQAWQRAIWEGWGSKADSYKPPTNDFGLILPDN